MSLKPAAMREVTRESALEDGGHKCVNLASEDHSYNNSCSSFEIEVLIALSCPHQTEKEEANDFSTPS